jgi:hypothetical protein
LEERPIMAQQSFSQFANLVAERRDEVLADWLGQFKAEGAYQRPNQRDGASDGMSQLPGGSRIGVGEGRP